MSRFCAALLVLVLSVASAAEPWPELSAALAKPSAERQAALESLLLDHPDFAAAQFNLGTLLVDQDAAAAAAHLERATQAVQVPLAADAWHNLALARWQLGQADAALEAAVQAARLDAQTPTHLALRDELRRLVLIHKDEARRAAEAAAKKLHMDAQTLPDAWVGEAYKAQLNAAGGSGEYAFALADNAPTEPKTSGKPAEKAPPPAMPAGLVLASDGAISGTPEHAGTEALRLAVRDHAGATATGAATLTIWPTPGISTMTLPEAIVNQPYRAELASVGLPAPLWQVDGLPDGLHVEATGVNAALVGVPTELGEHPLSISAEDGAHRATKSLMLLVSDSFAPERTVLEPATVWAPYHDRIGVRGPVGVYRWQGDSVHGLSVSEDGNVTGTPDASGELTLKATITASDGRSRTATLTISVHAPPVIEEAQPITLTAGTPVQRPLKESGGTPPFAWTITDGALPAGLRLDPDGSMRGVATTPTETTVMVGLKDRWEAATSKSIAVKVDKRPDQKPPKEKDQDQKDQDQKDQDQKKSDEQQQDQAQKDQKKDDQKGDQKDGQGKDQAEQSPKSPDKSGEKPKDGKPQADKKSKDEKKNGQPDDKKSDDQKNDPAQAEKQQAGKDSGKPLAGSDRKAQDAEHAQLLNEAAAEHWLDQLPKAKREVLRYQLLDGGERAPSRQTPEQRAQPW